MPHSRLTDLSPLLKPEEDIELFLDKHIAWFEELAQKFNVPLRFLLIQTLLHLPSFAVLAPSNDPVATMNKLFKILLPICEQYRKTYERLRQETNVGILTSDAKIIGRYNLQAIDGAAKLPVKFGNARRLTGKEIQRKLHYIRSDREDTIKEYGLFLDDAQAPYAYVSFSRANRKYQVNSLNEAADLSLSMHEVVAMTRAFAFDGSPLNSMSKLFHRAQEALQSEMPEVKAIITALNPYLGFSGGIFKGASYFPYALSPMEYWYDRNGLYVPRSKGTMPQKIPTPPIVWFARGMDAETSKSIEALRDREPVSVTESQYKSG